MKLYFDTFYSDLEFIKEVAKNQSQRSSVNSEILKYQGG